MAAPTLVASPEVPLQPLASRGPGRRLVRGLIFGLVATTAVLLGRGSGLLDGGTGLLVTVLLVLLVPTSREFSRRVLLAGCLVLGWTPVLWWWDVPVGGLGRVTLGLAVLVGGLGVWVGSGAHIGRRAWSLLPRVRWVDLLVPMCIGTGMVVLRPWLQPKSATQTMALLMAGWDNSAHFSMVHMTRLYGVTVDALDPPTTGGSWQFTSYPEGFHAVVATLIEVMLGPVRADLGTEHLGYARAVALLVIAATAVIVAGFCALPAIRRRPAVAAPVAAFVSAVFFFGPGANAIQGGFGNFAVACALVVAIVLVGVTMPRALAPLQLAAVGGAVVGVATGWVLLLALVVPALLVLVVPLRRRRWAASPVRIALTMVIVLAVAGCLMRTALVISRVQSADPLTLTGGIARPNLGLVLAATLVCFGACVLVGLRSRSRTGPQDQVTVLAAVPFVGAVTAAALVLLQVRANGTVTYYGLKFMTGLAVVLLVVLMVPVVHLLVRIPRRAESRTWLRGAGRRVGGVVASASIAVAATQVFGLATPDYTRFGLQPEAPGAVNRVQQIEAMDRPLSTADLVERVEALQQPLPFARAFYVDVPSDRRISSILAAQWFLALTDTWTAEANIVAGRDIQLTDDAAGPAVALKILSASTDTVVVVPAPYRDLLLRELGRPDLAGRIVGF